MIERREFERGMSLLSATYRAPVDEPLARLYFGVLTAALTTEQFGAAVQRTVAAERYWPSPAVILQHAGIQPARLSESDRAGELAGAAVFTHLLQMRTYTPHGYRLDWRRVEAELGVAAVRALQAIGGPSRVAEITCRDEPFARRDFARAYSTALAHPTIERPALGQVVPGPAVGELVTRVAERLGATRERATLPPTLEAVP